MYISCSTLKSNRMNRKLGIDLGENSIGWALIEGNEIRESRVRFFLLKERQRH